MKDKALGYGLWFLVGMLVVGIAGAFFVSFIKDTTTDVTSHRPQIATPPAVTQ